MHYKRKLLIAIENILISDDVLESQFVCDLSKCKGGCCEDGDAGAPLSKTELNEVNKAFDIVKPYMTKEGIAVTEKEGRYQYDREFGWVTPTIGGKLLHRLHDRAEARDGPGAQVIPVTEPARNNDSGIQELARMVRSASFAEPRMVS